MKCIPGEEGVIHKPHTYTPQDTDDEVDCEGVSGYKWESQDECRAQNEYRLAMWVTIDDVRMLYKLEKAPDLDTAREWLVEFDRDFTPGHWFIVRDVVSTQSYVVE